MLYRFFLSKKGFTFIEILIAVAVLGILTAVAVPLMGNAVALQRKKDCNNQRVMIKSTVEQAMFGMIDNGQKQPELYIDDAKNVNVTTIPTSTGSVYAGKKAFYIIDPENFTGNVEGVSGVTLGEIRNGYRNPDNVNSADYIEEYRDGCDEGYYLKKKKLADVPLYKYFLNQELPICPFANFGDSDTDNDYFYYITWDASAEDVVVVCSCPKCNEN